jgi:hypothetical protein
MDFRDVYGTDSQSLQRLPYRISSWQAVKHQQAAPLCSRMQ